MSIQADSEERMEIEMQASQVDTIEKTFKDEKSQKQPPWISSKQSQKS